MTGPFLLQLRKAQRRISMDNILKLMDEYIRHEKIEELKQIKSEIRYYDLKDDKQIEYLIDKHIKELEKE